LGQNQSPINSMFLRIWGGCW